jgi:hypothetical protein
MTEKHTPGPWKVIGCGYKSRLSDDTGTIAAEVIGPNHRTDARLIAAAPDMLAALKSIVEGCAVTGRWLDEDGNECAEGDEGARWEEYTGEEQDLWVASCADIARAAIAKAEPTT